MNNISPFEKIFPKYVVINQHYFPTRNYFMTLVLILKQYFPILGILKDEMCKS